MKRLLRRVGTVTATILFIALPITAWQHKLGIYDWARLRNYTANPTIAKLATDTTMTSQGRHVFYVYHPKVESKQSFAQHCRNNEQTIVLGCYVSGIGIYIYDVTDVRLTGVEEVTAAHEMLHAAYERLKPQEKQKINALLNQAFAKVDDKRIRTNIESYQKAGADVTNELHSILGTEVKNLPPDLEAYYKRYFSDRSRIVAYSDQYEALFTERQNRVAAADVSLKNLKAQIDSLDASLKTQAEDLRTERERMNGLLSSNRINEYNAAVGPYNQQVARYNTDVTTEKNLVGQYNAIVNERNSLVLEEKDLINALDSRTNTLQTR